MTIIRNEDGTMTLGADRLPGSVWGSNLRAILPTSRWVALSRRTAERAGRLCEVCGQPSFYGEGTRNPDCHEIWAFDEVESRSVQRLVGVIALCGACHETQHSGLAELNDRWESVITTLCRVNGWDRADAEADIERSRERYRDLSNTEWDLDLTLLGGWVALDGYSDLRIPSADRANLGNTLDKTKRKLSLIVGAEIPDPIWRW
ncbi:hypothetical protein [Microbacterium sp. SORGH_AS_0421]|uniref:hypothetical protein n=1 Tax=Microbacterium sp. SORGH_AS_0421 TaxID=3041768 RepID=UPI002791B294|nr:hypothetical protein [Microbacterium sp. SORGH_AS_0421]MDQ1176688.1 hypothetical protein [Microbacterium sp. SORGH_AS_0421]